MEHFTRLGVKSKAFKKSNLFISKAVSFIFPKWLLQAPAYIPASRTKIYSIRMIVACIGAFCHLSLVAVYLVFGSYWLALVNIISSLWFLGAAVITRKVDMNKGIFLTLLEPAVHIPFMTYIIGTEAGYLSFNYAISMLAMLVYSSKEIFQRIIVISYAMISTVVLLVTLDGAAPPIALSASQLNAISWITGGTTFVALIALAYHFATVTEEAETKLSGELERSNQLLLNILPPVIAEELKSGKETISNKFDFVTVLFSDIVGFTKMSSQTSAPEIVKMLNYLFSEFDLLAQKYGLEKIKTIGDAYMVAGGLPLTNDYHAYHVANMGLDMLEVIKQYREDTGQDLNLRIGIHTGPVVAGVIGMHKFTYDLWGDTVNLASRMESHGEPGKIQISESTHNFIKDRFELETRGVIDVKGRGTVKTWYVKDRKNGIRPINNRAA